VARLGERPGLFGTKKEKPDELESGYPTTLHCRSTSSSLEARGEEGYQTSKVGRRKEEERDVSLVEHRRVIKRRSRLTEAVVYRNKRGRKAWRRNSIASSER